MSIPQFPDADASWVPHSPFGLYVRRVVEVRRNRQSRGMFCSEKVASRVDWTTAGQRDAMTLLEFQHNITHYRVWPLPVAIVVEGVRVDYHPLLEMTTITGKRVVVDLCRSEDAAGDDRRQLDGLLTRSLAASGIGFISADETAVRADRKLKNARALLVDVRTPVGPDAEFVLSRLIARNGGTMSFRELLASGSDGRALLASAAVLAMRRVLRADLSRPTLGDCTVSLSVAGA